MGSGWKCSVDTFLPKILADRGEAHRITEPGISEEVWAELGRLALAEKGGAVSDTRFFASVRENKMEDKLWHSRLLGYTLACLELDMLHGAKFDNLVFNKDTGEQTMAASAAASKAVMRKACQRGPEHCPHAIPRGRCPFSKRCRM
eukprot:4287919-Amphidinium_carterae.1